MYKKLEESVDEKLFLQGQVFLERLNKLKKIFHFFWRYKVGYPISLLTPKTAPPCPSKDLRGPAPGHPGVL